MDLPVGYRFMPTDEELVAHYLMMKVSCRPLPSQIVQEIAASELYDTHPKFTVTSSCGEKEWFFFIREDENFPGETIRSFGGGKGFWKSMGEERPICNMNGDVFAFKTNLIYFSGSRSGPRKTHWKMELYRLPLEFYTNPKFEGEKWVIGKVKRGIDFKGCF